jgi:hypothetical protein
MTTDVATAKRAPSGNFARPESALADSGLAHSKVELERLRSAWEPAD